MPRIDSSDDELEEIAVLPFKSSSGHVVKPSAALLDPSNTAKVPGQPHSTRKDPKESECEPKRRKPKPKLLVNKRTRKFKMLLVRNFQFGVHAILLIHLRFS
jgi:hypothetical protein